LAFQPGKSNVLTIILLTWLSLAAFVNAATLLPEFTNPPPFFMFSAYRFSSAADGEAVCAILRQYFSNRDYIGSEYCSTEQLRQVLEAFRSRER
jgi:hypothetical protein